MSSTEGVMSDKVVAEWAPAERESFFLAIQRHRRAAWRVRAASMLANAVVAFVVALLMSPLFYVVIFLSLDLVNLVVPTPNFVHELVSAWAAATRHPEPVQWYRPLEFDFLAAAPGLLWMAMVIRMLSRVLKTAATAGAQMQARPVDRQVLAEQRFANVIDEMAIAAGLPVPSVLVTPREMLNAAVFGPSELSATIIVSESLLATLTRQEMQGVAADLVASIADGDLTIGQRIAVTISLFGLITRFGSVLDDEDGFRQVWRLSVVLVRPKAASAQPFLQEISDPFAHEGPRKPRRRARAGQAAPIGPAASSARAGRVGSVEPAAFLVSSASVAAGVSNNAPAKESNWRLWLWLPLAGPVVMSGFFTGFVSMFVLRPLVGLAWRQRKYMADAVAVRLTRDPDALASALGRMGSGESLAPWLGHLSVVSGHKRGELLGGIVPMFPSLERRLRALRKLGASIAPPPRKPVDWRLFVFGVPLMTLFVTLAAILIVLLACLPLFMAMLFTGVPFAVLHLLLRAIGH